MVRLHKRYGLVRNSLSHISRYLALSPMFMFPKKNMSNLDKKAEKCICIGYKDGLKGYKLWNPKNNKVVHI
jgi:hypothetical protein